MNGIRLSLAVFALGLALSLIYVPDVGHGFIKDDFNWILTSRIAHPREAASFFTRHTGFYRPLVSASFALDYALFGLNSFPYGLTNFALLVLSAVAVAMLARTLGMSRGVSLLAATIWSLNFHGINMAVLWISGRTSLLLTLCSILATISFLQKKFFLSACWYFLALLSKEEAVLLPVVFTVGSLIGVASGGTVHTGFVRRFSSVALTIWPSLAALAAYSVLRLRTDALLPSTAPDFYRFTFDAPSVLRNVAEYSDRACTWPFAVALLLAAVARRLPRITDPERRWIQFGAGWIVTGFGLTVFLPVRSSLYAVFPSVGAALIAASLSGALWREFEARGQTRLVLVGLSVPFLLLPVYHSRNVRWVKPAELSANVLHALRAADLPDGSAIILIDQRTARWNLAASFGTLITEAVRLCLEKDVSVWIEPPVPDAGLGELTRSPKEVIRATFMLRNGQLVRID